MFECDCMGYGFNTRQANGGNKYKLSNDYTLFYYDSHVKFNLSLTAVIGGDIGI